MKPKLGVKVMPPVQYLILLADAVMTVSRRTTTIQLVSTSLAIVQYEALRMAAPLHQVDNLTG